MAESAALLVDDVLPRVPMRQWVLTVPFPLRFLLAARPAVMGQVLGIVYRALATHLIHQAGHTQATACTGAVTLIQRFGGALNLNIHFHMLCLDGVYVTGPAPRFQRLPTPRHDELLHLLHTISQRIARCLEKHGLLVRDMDNSYLDLEPGDASPLDTVLGHAITYRIAVGPNAGRKVFTLQTVPAMDTPTHRQLAQLDGFSLHAGVATEAHQRHKLERLCRYISRPAVAEERLSLTAGGNIRYRLKTPYQDGTTHVIFEPLDFIARLAALVPKPRVNLTRFHGVFAPHSQHRALVTPAGRGSGKNVRTTRSADERHAAMTWARRLRRVFRIDIETCDRCGGRVRILASIEDPAVIARILEHIERCGGAESAPTPRSRAPPSLPRFD